MPFGSRIRDSCRCGLDTCCLASPDPDRRATPTGHLIARHTFDEKRHRAAGQSQGCRRDYHQTVEGHGQSDGKLDGHIFEKGHTFGKGHTLEKGHRLEKEEGHIEHSPPATQAVGAKNPTVAIVMRARFIVYLPLNK